MTITRKIKIGKIWNFIFLSIQSIPDISCKLDNIIIMMMMMMQSGVTVSRSRVMVTAALKHQLPQLMKRDNLFIAFDGNALSSLLRLQMSSIQLFSWYVASYTFLVFNKMYWFIVQYIPFYVFPFNFWISCRHNGIVDRFSCS